MSVDNRVVKLQFDNQQFEKGVSQSMSTLDKLESKLQFKNSAKGFSTLQNAAEAVHFDKLVAGIDAINNKLSAGGIIAAKFVSNIAESVANGVKKVEQASLGQIKSGGWARAMKIENAKFAVQGLKGDWDELYKAIDYSVSGTAYGVDSAAKAASTLMASGVDYMKTVETKDGQQLTQMHKSLRAISGVAAQTNSEFDDIAHIFTTVAGNGRLMADQLNQLSGRGMNAAAILGEQLHMTEAQVREATSKGQIDFKTFADAMDSAFGDHAKDANKTFTGSLSNMKAALSRFGAVFATPIIQKTNTFFIALTGQINKMKKAIADVTENGKVLETRLEGHFAKMWENLITLASTLVESVDLTWFEKIANSADNFVSKMSDAFEMMNAFASATKTSTDKTAKKAYDTSTITAGELDVVERIIRGQFGNGAKRKKELDQYLKENEMNYDPEKLQAYVNVLSKVNYIFEKAGIKLVKQAGEETEAYNRKQQSVQQTFINIFSAIHNFNAALSKLKDSIGEYASRLLQPFGGVIGIVEQLTGIISTLVVGFDTLVESIKPTSGVLYGFYDVGRALADTFEAIVGGIKSAIDWVSKFIYSVIEGWKQSGVFEDTLINIANTVRNLTRIIKNLAKTASRIFKAIATAFFRVFNPAKASGLLSKFTGGLADVSENFVLSEDAAEALTDILTGLFTVIDGIATAIGNIVVKVTEFIGSLGKGKKVTQTVAESTEDVGKEVEKTTSIFDKLIGVGTKVKDFFSKFIDTARELFDKIGKTDGVQRLKESLDKFFDIFKKDAAEKFDKFKEGLKSITDGESKKLTIDDVAEGIGKFAGLLANFVDKLPEYLSKIGGFFSKVKEFFGGFFKDAEEEAEEAGESLGFFDKIVAFVEGIGDNVKNLFDWIIKNIKKLFEGLSWGDIINSAFVVGALSLFKKLSSAAETIEGAFDSISGIFEAVEEVVANAGEMLKAVAKSITNFSTAALIGTIAVSIALIVASIYFIAQLDDSQLYNAISVITVVGIVMTALIKATASLTKAKAAKLRASYSKNAIIKDISMAAIGMVKMVAVILLVIALIKTIISSVEKLTDILDKYKNTGVLEGAIVAIVVILAAVLGLSIILIVIGSKLTKKMQMGSKKMKSVVMLITVLAIAISAIGVAVFLLAQSIAAIAEVGNISQATGAVVALLATLVGSIILIMLFAQSMSPDQLVTIGLLMLEVVVAMMIIFGGIYFLALAMSGSEALGKFTGVEEQISKAVLLVCGVMLALALSIMLISLGVKSVVQYGNRSNTDAKLMGKVMLGMVALIGVVMICVVLIAKSLAEMNNEQLLAFTAGLALIAVILIAFRIALGGIAEIFKSFANAKQMKKAAELITSIGYMMVLIFAGIALIVAAFTIENFSASQILSIALVLAVVIGGLIGVIAVIGKLAKGGADVNKFIGISKSLLLSAAAFVVLVLAVGVLAEVIKNLGGIDEKLIIYLGGLILICIALVAAFGLAAKLVSSIPNFSDNVMALSVALMGFGVLVIALAAAAMLFESVSPDGMVRMTVVVLGLIAVMALLAFIFGKSTSMQAGLGAVANFMISLGVALVLFGASLVIAAVGIGMLTAVLPGFGEAFAEVCQVLSEHSGVVIGVGVLIVAILLIVGFVMIKTLPIINNIVTAVTKALETIWDIIKKVGKKISDGVSNFHNNQNLSKGVKATIVTLIIALASSLTEAGPTVLQKIGDFLWMLIDWFISIVPKLCDKIVEIILELIWGILDALTNHINEIEAAIKAILLTIGAIIVKLLIDLLADGLDVLFGWIPGVSKLVKKMKSAGDKVISDAKKTTQALKEEARARDKLIREGSYMDESGILTIDGYSDLDTANAWNKQLGLSAADAKLSAKEMQEATEAVKKKTDEAFKTYVEIQKKAGKPIDWSKTFLYASAIDTDKVNYNELQAWIKQGKAFYSDYEDTYYKIMEENAAILDADPMAANSYAHYYTEAKKKSSGIVDGLKDGFSSITGGGLTDQLSADNLTEGLDLSSVTGSLGDQMPALDGSSVIDINSINKTAESTGSDAGELMVFSAGDSARDAAEVMGPEAASTFGDTFDSELVGNDEDHERAADTIVTTVADKMADDENKAKVADASVQLAKESADRLSGQQWRFIQAGGDLVEGFMYHPLKFINAALSDPDGARALMNRMYNVMNNQLTGSSCFNTGSPSKRMMEIGQQIVQGLTNGIYDEEGNAVQSMTDLYSMMNNTFAAPLDYVSKVASGEYRYDPSIRPVLDTSSIAAGANGINSLFNNQNVSLSGISGTIAADIGRLDNSNADIIKELRLLRSDMNKMNEDISNMQVVMDTGRLVGAISTDMDGALGSRSSYRSRGKGN